MEQDLRNKVLFAIHLDQAMSYFEGFYRESFKDEEKRLMEAGEKMNREQRKSYKKKVDKIISNSKKETKTFLKDNYRFIEQIENNMSPENQDSLEHLCIKVGELMELLMDNNHNEDVNILLSLYKEGHLNDFLNKIKNDAEDNKKDS